MESLKKLGLTKYEISIYKALLKNKKLNAKELSEQSKVPPTAVYPNLNSLKEKRLIQKIDGDPAVFEILSPKAAINNLVTQRKKSLAALETKAIKEATSLLSETPTTKEKEIIKLTKGKAFSSEIYDEAIKKVNKTLYTFGWRFNKVGNRYEYLRKLKSIVKKGIDVRIIVTGDYKKNIELIEAYKKEKIKLRFYKSDNFSILVIDGKECKITLKDQTLPEKHNLQIMDPSLSQAMHSYFLDLWDKAEPI
ncbi:MAG: helix-turn-helix domain-containing protein [archaeon]